MTFFDAVGTLTGAALAGLCAALFVAFAFEFINGFHDTANAVATVIYTRSLPASVAVPYSAFLNFLGVVLGGTGVAFGIVNLLPVDRLVDSSQTLALLMVFSLLIAGVVWNLGTWYIGLPVSSSHTLIGSILGVGLANGLLEGRGFAGVNWDETQKVGLALLFSPLVGFLFAGGLLLVMKFLVRDARLYTPVASGEEVAPPPGWIRGTLVATCGGVSFAHGANDGAEGDGPVASSHHRVHAGALRAQQPARDGVARGGGRGRGDPGAAGPASGRPGARG